MIVCVVYCVLHTNSNVLYFIQAIAEGGATGPTFRPEGMNKGFAVLTIAGRKMEL